MTEPTAVPIRLPGDALVVLAGPSGSGKSSWAERWFRPSQIVSSDRLRGVVGTHEHDLRASSDAFAVLETIVERRLARGLLTVVDTLGMDLDRLVDWRRLAADHDRPCHLVRFDEAPATCRKRNRARPDPVPAKVLAAQLERWAQLRDQIIEGFDAAHAPAPVAVIGRHLLPAESGATATMQFGLLIQTFEWPGGSTGIAERLRAVAVEAEHAGFDSLWVMDHFMQIPQVGRDWDAMLEAYTTLSWMAACTSRVAIGALVTCVTHRNLAHLGKTVATLDVLSEGRARCGLGLGWYEREHVLHGYRFPPVAERYELLEDALRFLPLQWGPGTPPFEGRRFSTPEARGYPRPLQERIPILVGGSGERHTLRLVAEYADACNVSGEPDVVANKLEVLRRHCADAGRSPDDIEVTQLSPILCARDESALRRRVDDLRTGPTNAEDFVERANAGTVDDHIGRFGRLAAAGVQTAIVSLADIGHDGAVADFAPVIAALSP